MSEQYIIVHQNQHDQLEYAVTGISSAPPMTAGPFKRRLPDGTIHIGYARWNYRTIPPTLEY